MEEKKRTSHDVAKALREMARKLTAAPEFDVSVTPMLYWSCWDAKDEFLGAARCFGGVKGGDSHDFELRRHWGGAETLLRVKRETVCRIVKPAQPAVYECDPLLTAAEEAVAAGGGQ